MFRLQLLPFSVVLLVVADSAPRSGVPVLSPLRVLTLCIINMKCGDIVNAVLVSIRQPPLAPSIVLCSPERTW